MTGNNIITRGYETHACNVLKTYYTLSYIPPQGNQNMHTAVLENTA